MNRLLPMRHVWSDGHCAGAALCAVAAPAFGAFAGVGIDPHDARRGYQRETVRAFVADLFDRYFARHEMRVHA